ncbi:alpha/beta hydrolase [Streptomyces sp. NPDC005805]|uniref:alpha/beta hydrolase family protein n=1 Tax=Streptomyces sp. NPDC005805 TaxID=3157068 RepID=UPI0033C416CB
MIKSTRAAVAATILSLAAVALPAGSAAAATTPQPPAPAATAAPADRLALPAPTGAHRLGRAELHLVDRSRTDPWVPGADGRELMVTLTYPAARHGHGPGQPRPVRYAAETEARLLLAGVGVTDPADVREVARTRTHATAGARPAPGRHPLVLLSPGFGVPRFTLTTLAEDLASRGYVVASVDHAYESSGTAVPDGRVLTCVACEALDEGGVPASVVTDTRAADMRFLLDRLTGPRPAWAGASSIDRSRIGMAGHSIGGAAAATAMARDRRIDAGVNMDGAFWDASPAALDGRPFLLLGTDDEVHRPGGTGTWDTAWRQLDGWKRWLTVAGSDHFSFSDGPLLQSRFGLPAGEIAPGRAVAVTRAYVGAFLDRQLRGVPSPLLDGPSRLHPEVRFHHR